MGLHDNQPAVTRMVTNRFLRHGYVASALLTVSSIVLLAIAVDLVAFHIFDIKYSGYRPERFFQYSTLTGHFHKPSSEGYWYRYYDGTKFKVRTNKYGFADSERTVEKTRPRIALIGDSVVEFWEVEEKDRGQYVIEALLDGAYEVMSHGVRGFGTDQTYVLFEQVGVHFSPDIVIYTLTINDVWDNSNTTSKPYFVLDPTTPNGLVVTGYPIARTAVSQDLGIMDRYKRGSLVYRKLDFGLRLIKASLGQSTPVRSVPLAEHFELRPYKKIYDREDSRRMEITLRLIAMLRDFAQSQKMKFLLVEGLYKPVQDEWSQKRIIREYGEVIDFAKVTTLLGDFCRAERIAFLSLPTAIDSRGVAVSTLMHPDDAMHLNAAGIRLYSEVVVEKLRALKWVE